VPQCGLVQVRYLPHRALPARGHRLEARLRRDPHAGLQGQHRCQQGIASKRCSLEAVGEDAESREEIALVLRDIEVLKAPASAGAGATKLSGSNSGLSVLLAVTDTQVQKLFHVLKHGDWSFELRPPVKSSDSPETIVSVGSILRDGLRAGQLDQLESAGGTP